jgi:hypothetical protein
VIVRLGKYLLIAALVATTGLHWAALQTVAWTTMLAGNLCSDSFSEAVSKTFDGEHPCPLCKAIAAAKKSGKKSEAIAPVLKMEFPPLAEEMVLFPPSPSEPGQWISPLAESRCAKPALPPPRCLPI